MLKHILDEKYISFSMNELFFNQLLSTITRTDRDVEVYTRYNDKSETLSISLNK